MRPTDLPDPGARVPRHSNRPLPAYRYVPGLHPHPLRDAAGHSYAAPKQHAQPWRPEDWPRLDAWLYGVDLFNAFYFWEAHEAWEALWAVVPRDSMSAVFLQGLIQLAAAMLKLHLGVQDGAQRLADQGRAKLETVALVTPHTMGLDVRRFSHAMRDFFAPLQRGSPPAIDHRVPTLRLTQD